MDFYYDTGQSVSVGDTVYTGNISNGQRVQGVVKEIFQPNTPDAKNHSCLKTGGIFIAEDWSGEESYLLVTPLADGEYWNDLILIKQG